MARALGPPLSQSESDFDAELMERILGYFVRNPAAADTLEGVTRQRLLEEQIHRTIRDTAAVLDWLVSRGYLEEVTIPGSRRIYRLDPAKRAEAARFLTERRSK